MIARSWSGVMSKTRRTWSSCSRCWPVTTTRTAKSCGKRRSSRTTGAIFTASGRVPKTQRTRAGVTVSGMEGISATAGLEDCQGRNAEDEGHAIDEPDDLRLAPAAIQEAMVQVALVRNGER